MGKLSNWLAAGALTVIAVGAIRERLSHDARTRERIANVEAKFATALRAFRVYDSVLTAARAREDSLTANADTVVRVVLRDAPALDTSLSRAGLDTVPAVRRLRGQRDSVIRAAAGLRGALESCRHTRDSVLALGGGLGAACTELEGVLAPLASRNLRRWGLGFTGPFVVSSKGVGWGVAGGVTYRLW